MNQNSAWSSEVVGVDVGGTNTKVAWFQLNDAGNGLESLVPIAKKTFSTSADFDAAMDALVRALRTRGCPSRLGVGVPGVVDSTKIHLAANLGNWTGRDLAQELKSRLTNEVRVVVSNDMQAQARGAHRAGYGECVVYVNLGTGCAAAVFIDDRPVTARLGGGEIGHIRVDLRDCPDAASNVLRARAMLRCDCGKVGCLERVVAGKAIVEVFRELTAALGETAERDPTEPKDVFDFATNGSDAAKLAFESLGVALGNALSHPLLLLNPDRVTFVGGVSLAFELFRTSLEETLARHRLPIVEHVNVYRPSLEVSEFAEDAGLLGAARLAIASFSADGLRG